MVRGPTAQRQGRSIDRFFQISLFALLTSGYLALAGSGRLGASALVLTSAVLLIRLALILGMVRLPIRDGWVTAATLAYIGFYPLDYFFVSGEFLPATVHLVLFVAMVKVLTAKTDRDDVQVLLIAFMEMLIASVLSSNLSFFVFLVVFLFLTVTTLSSWEIRRSIRSPATVARSSLGLGLRLSTLGICVTGGILVFTAGLFFFLPRTARAAFQHLAPERYHLSGFSDQVTLGEIGEIKRQETVLMHVRTEGMDAPLNLKWRGNALGEFDGRKWFNSVEQGEALRVNRRQLTLADDHQLRRRGPSINYEVQLKPFASDLLFIAGLPEYLRINSRLVIRTPSDGYRVGYRSGGVLRYGVYSFLTEGAVDAPPVAPALTPAERETYLQLPELDPRIRQLAERITATALDAHRKAGIIESRLRNDYSYTLQLLEREVDDPISHFLFDRRQGHCEYFASAMAVMLRTVGIPSRVATGFQGGIYNPLSGWQVIRAADAHSWVEAWIPGSGWVTFDPTPADPSAGVLSLWTRASLLIDAAEIFWQDWVLSYDWDRQQSLAARMDESRRLFSLDWLSDAGSSWRSHLGVLWESLRENRTRLAAGLAVLALLIWIGPRLAGWLRLRRRSSRLERGEVQAADATI
ncbi:MAG: DUF3488 domain-containing transglutaminase family protein, partial [bacterium]|nr:DUF3488 domain-containing transglutaminase family protein [bacterium]